MFQHMLYGHGHGQGYIMVFSMMFLKQNTQIHLYYFLLIKNHGGLMKTQHTNTMYHCNNETFPMLHLMLYYYKGNIIQDYTCANTKAVWMGLC